MKFKMNEYLAQLISVRLSSKLLCNFELNTMPLQAYIKIHSEYK